MKLLQPNETNTSLTKEQTNWLREQVKASQEADKAMFKENSRMVDLLKGKHYKGKDRGAIINLVHSVLRSMLPALYFKEPTVMAYPRHPNAAGKEEHWNRVLNATIRRIGFKKQIKEAVFDCIVQREGWIKLGITVPEGENTLATSEEMRGPTPWGGKVAPFVQRIAPNNVIVDSLAPGRDIQKARYVAIRYTRHIDELRADPRYDIPKEVHRKYMLTAAEARGTRFKEESQEDGPRLGYNNNVEAKGDIVEFYEVWIYELICNDEKIKLQRQMVVVSDISDKPLRMESYDNVIGTSYDHFPLRRMALNPVPDDVPVAEVEAWEPLQHNLNWVMTKTLNFVRNQALKYWADKSNIEDDKFENKLLSSKEEVITIKDVNKNPGFGAIQGQPVPQDFWRLAESLIGLVEMVSQFGQNRLGASANFRTATEASVVAQSSNMRDNERVDIVQDFLKEIVTDIAQLIMEHADTDFVFRLAGDVGTVQWATFSPEDIRWMPDIEIEVNSFREMDAKEEAVKYLQILNMAIQMLPVTGPIVDIVSLMRDYMKAVKVPNPEKFLKDVMGEREYQMLEIMQMIQGQQVQAAPTDPHPEHISAIETFMASPVYAQVSPDVRMMVQQHLEEHQAFQQQLQEQQGGQPSTLDSNPMDVGANTNANIARQQTAFEREAISTRQGTGGQL